MILIIDKSLSNARRFSDMLYYMGYLSISATYKELHTVSKYPYSCAVALYPESTGADYEASFDALRALSKIPIFAISECPYTLEPLFDFVFEKGISAPALISRISDYAKERMLNVPGSYKIMGINASPELITSLYFDTPLPFTKTENMILRALTFSYPNPLFAEDILKLAFRHGRLPELASIRTHISVMNKKFRAKTGRSLINCEKGCGYTLLTPEEAHVLQTV